MIVIKIYLLFLSTWTKLVSGMSEERRLLLRDEAKEMFYHSYNSYLKYGYPADEVSPRTCKPLKRLKENLANVGVNDVRGNYALTLVDSLDTLAVMGDRDGFEKAVKLVIKDVSFNVNNKVQVFEVTIRMLGGLLSAHLLATDPKLGFQLPWYKDELLHLAQDLGDRLIPAFEQSPTGIPFARVNLKSGVPKLETSETCLAGVGTLMLEFGTLSRLTNKPIYEELAKKALMKVWSMQFNNGLFGCTINLKKGTWIDSMTGIGAGLDSFYEYLLKTAILFDDNQYMDMFYQSYSALYNQIRDKSGHLYLNVDAKRVVLHNSWIDSLSAFLPGMQVLAGDLDGAIKTHLIYYNIWQKYGAMPERYDLSNGHAPILYYPLRPELFESNYYLYQATRDPFYLEVGEMMLVDLQNNTRLPCGYGSVKNVLDMTVDDRMESFFLSETLKYLYLLFDTDNIFNSLDSSAVFNTEGHILPLPSKFKNSSFKKQEPMRVSWPDTCPAFKKDLFHPSTIINRPDFYYAQHLAIQNLYDIPANPNSKTKSVVPTSVSYSDAFLTKKVNPEPENVGIPEPTIEEIDETYPRNVVQNFKVLKIAADKLVPHTTAISGDSDNEWAGISIKSITGEDDDAHSTLIPAALSNFGPSATKSFIMQSLTFLPKELNGCSKIPEPVSQNLKSKFVIVPRGNCTFVEKVYHLQLSGAVGVIFHSHQNKYHFPAVGHLKKVNEIITIPSALITNSSAIRIHNMMDRHPYLAIGFEKASSEELFNNNDYLI